MQLGQNLEGFSVYHYHLVCHVEQFFQKPVFKSFILYNIWNPSKMEMDNALYADPVCRTCQNDVFYKAQIPACADVNRIGLLCLYLSYSVNHTLSHFLDT